MRFLSLPARVATGLSRPRLRAHNAGKADKGKRPMRALLVAFLAMLVLTRTAAAQIDPALIAAAEKEGTVVWYTGLIVNQIVRPMVDAFQKQYPGVHVQYARASNTETTLKILNEVRARRVQADVFDVTSGI